MIYVMSDLHGRYDEFLEMLELIQFHDDDYLFILGDLVDRGTQGMKLILDLQYRANIFCLAGNHDRMALVCLHELGTVITRESIDDMDELKVEMISEWIGNLGGLETMEEFKTLSPTQKTEVLDYLGELTMYDTVIVNNQTYLLAHTLGAIDFERDKPLDEYSDDNWLWDRCDYSMKYFLDKILVTGHTPTALIHDESYSTNIFIKNNHIAVDCGMQKLGCLCLDTMEEFYVE